MVGFILIAVSLKRVGFFLIFRGKYQTLKFSQNVLFVLSIFMTHVNNS